MCIRSELDLQDNLSSAFVPDRAVGVEIQPAVHIHAEDGEQRLVKRAVLAARRHPQIDPDAVRHAVAVVVDVPGASVAAFPEVWYCCPD